MERQADVLYTVCEKVPASRVLGNAPKIIDHYSEGMANHTNTQDSLTKSPTKAKTPRESSNVCCAKVAPHLDKGNAAMPEWLAHSSDILSYGKETYEVLMTHHSSW